MKKILLALVILLAVLLVAGFLWGVVGFPQIHAGDCKCLGIKKYFDDAKGIRRCACYGITTWFWTE